MANLATVYSCGSASCSPLTYFSGRYGYSTTYPSSGFTRTIKAIPTSPDEVTITSTVSWNQGSGAHSITFSEDLFNWVE